jgi:site-specific DNA-methyltransferase (adenine-specific)
MNEQVSFTLRGRNPDVLTCIANLSNDEVFTPPELAGRMLDMLAQAWAADHGDADLWADKTVRFLDPFTKSGVFLRAGLRVARAWMNSGSRCSPTTVCAPLLTI